MVAWHVVERCCRVLVFVDVVAVVESFVDSHDFSDVWRLWLSQLYGFEDLGV